MFPVWAVCVLFYVAALQAMGKIFIWLEIICGVDGNLQTDATHDFSMHWGWCCIEFTRFRSVLMIDFNTSSHAPSPCLSVYPALCLSPLIPLYTNNLTKVMYWHRETHIHSYNWQTSCLTYSNSRGHASINRPRMCSLTALSSGLFQCYKQHIPRLSQSSLL